MIGLKRERTRRNNGVRGQIGGIICVVERRGGKLQALGKKASRGENELRGTEGQALIYF